LPDTGESEESGADATDIFEVKSRIFVIATLNNLVNASTSPLHYQNNHTVHDAF
jgi:hypothetical protein